MGKMPQLMVAAIFCARGVVQEISTPHTLAAAVIKNIAGLSALWRQEMKPLMICATVIASASVNGAPMGRLTSQLAIYSVMGRAWC